MSYLTDTGAGALANSFGTPTTGNGGAAWSRNGGVASQYARSGTSLDMTFTAANQTLSEFALGFAARDIQCYCQFATDKLAVGAKIYPQMLGRALDISNYYRVAVALATATDPNGANSIDLTAYSVAAGTSTPIVTVADPVNGIVQVPRETHVAGQKYNLLIRFTGASPTTIQAKVWRVGTDQPSGWDATWTDSVSALQVAAGAGLLAFLNTGASNAPVVVSFSSVIVDDIYAAAVLLGGM